MPRDRLRRVTALRWDRTNPYRCACDNTYQPRLNARGTLVKTRDPAWRMPEQTRDPGCLQEHCRTLSKVYRLSYQHHKISRGSGGGYPDVHLWTALRPAGGGSVFIELKRMGQDPTSVQVRVMATLQDAGHLVYLARPCCLLTGALDEIMAELAGRPCLYVKDGPAYTPVEVPDGAPIPARDAKRHPPAAATHPGMGAPAVARRRPVFRLPPPPGADPVPFTPAVGYLIPSPGGDRAAAAAMLELEQWLRTAGFSPMDVPYPIRIVAGAGQVHVHCRIGLARPGTDQRVWRAGTPPTRFPDHLTDALAALVLDDGEPSDQVAARVAATVPATRLV